MFEFRVTKYDPRFRTAEGAYLRSEWTSISDIGRSFLGIILTDGEYQRTENAYVASAQAFLEEAGVGSLCIQGLEKDVSLHPQLVEGTAIPSKDVAALLTKLLREELWCRLTSPEAFIHVGYDYYMYIGVPHPCLFAQRRAASLGLFVEPFPSPYHEETAA